MTGSQSAAFARSKIGQGYIYGAKGQTCTSSFRRQQAQQYPDQAQNILVTGAKWDGERFYQQRRYCHGNINRRELHPCKYDLYRRIRSDCYHKRRNRAIGDKKQQRRVCEHCQWLLNVTYKDGQMWRCVY